MRQCQARYERERERLARAETRLAAEIADFEKEVSFKRRMKPLHLDLEQVERMLAGIRFDEHIQLPSSSSASKIIPSGRDILDPSTVAAEFQRDEEIAN